MAYLTYHGNYGYHSGSHQNPIVEGGRHHFLLNCFLQVFCILLAVRITSVFGPPQSKTSLNTDDNLWTSDGLKHNPGDYSGILWDIHRSVLNNIMRCPEYYEVS